MTTRYLLYTAFWLALMAALLFGAGGDLSWPEAWVFAGEYAVLGGAVVIWLARHDPALLRERFAAPLHRDQAFWDRLFLTGVMVVFICWMILIGLDARRFAWSHMPVGFEALGGALFAAGMIVVWLTFRANTFAVPQARLQTARGQSVIDKGPYAYVRHPMYLGAALYFLGMPMLLGSWFGLLAAPFFAIAMAARAAGEERMLRRGLAGYEDYAARVRWRLVPGVW